MHRFFIRPEQQKQNLGNLQMMVALSAPIQSFMGGPDQPPMQVGAMLMLAAMAEPVDLQTTIAYRQTGKKSYELKDHLGNLRATVSDRRYSHDLATTEETYNYYPFGMHMPGRQMESGYRYGFQGQEKDDETGLINYKYRLHNPAIGRFFAVDPLAPKYPHNSPYAFSENRVIDGVELEGLEVLLVGKVNTQSLFVSGFTEGGIVIDFNDGSIWAYGSYGYGVESDLSISSALSVTFFRTMPNALYAGGTGYSASVNGDILGASASLGWVKSGDYHGVNFQVGVGASFSPYSVSAYKSETYIKPITDKAVISEYMSLLSKQVKVIEKNLLNPLKERVESLSQKVEHQKNLLQNWKVKYEDCECANVYTLEAWSSIIERGENHLENYEAELEKAQEELNVTQEFVDNLKEKSNG